MESSGLVRWGALALFLGGTVWLVLGLFNVFDGLLAIPGRKDGVVLLALGLVLTAARGLWGRMPCRRKVTDSWDERVSTSPSHRSSLEPCVT